MTNAVTTSPNWPPNCTAGPPKLFILRLLFPDAASAAANHREVVQHQQDDAQQRRNDHRAESFRRRHFALGVQRWSSASSEAVERTAGGVDGG